MLLLSFPFFCFLFFYNTLSLSFLLCSFCDSCKTWASSTGVCDVVRCAFSGRLLWSLPPLASLLQKKKKKRNLRSKATDSVWIFGISLFLSQFQERVFFGGNRMGFPKVSDKYPHPKTKFVSPTRPSESSASLLKKRGSLVWLKDSLQQDECGFHVAPLQTSVSDRSQN